MIYRDPNPDAEAVRITLLEYMLERLSQTTKEHAVDTAVDVACRAYWAGLDRAIQPSLN